MLMDKMIAAKDELSSKIHSKSVLMFMVVATLLSVSLLVQASTNGQSKIRKNSIVTNADEIIQQYTQADWFSGNVTIIKDNHDGITE